MLEEPTTTVGEETKDPPAVEQPAEPEEPKKPIISEEQLEDMRKLFKVLDVKKQQKLPIT